MPGCEVRALRPVSHNSPRDEESSLVTMPTLGRTHRVRIAAEWGADPGVGGGRHAVPSEHKRIGLVRHGMKAGRS